MSHVTSSRAQIVPYFQKIYELSEMVYRVSVCNKECESLNTETDRDGPGDCKKFLKAMIL